MASPEISRAEATVYTLVERILGHWATSKIIAVSDEERELILTLKLIPRIRAAVVANGVDEQDLEYFSEGHNRDGISHKPLTFGSIMRFTPQKAPGHLVEAFIRLVDMVPDVPLRLVLAGDGELFAGIKRQVEESGLGKNISLLEWRTDTRDVLREFDVFVLSSLYEGFSYSLLEAMAAKLPVISTKVFGTKARICQIPGNIVVPTRDPVALSQGMKRMATLTDSSSLRRALRTIDRPREPRLCAYTLQ
jgi:glycosyltransferase involved in cell wall biosynthesis